MTLLVIEVRAPAVESIRSSTELWHALRHAMPAIFAFVLSFTIVFITWVNHHAAIKLIPKTCASFIYANGLLLLMVAFLPFPTALLGEFVLTDHAGPAVMLYNAVLAGLAVAWVVGSRAALVNDLARDDEAAAIVRANGMNGVWAFVLYAALAVAGLWAPRVVALVTTATWVFWLVLGARIKRAWD